MSISATCHAMTHSEFVEHAKVLVEILQDISQEIKSQREQVNVIPYQHAKQKYQFVTIISDKSNLKNQLDTFGEEGFQVQAMSPTDIIGEFLVILCRPLTTLYPDMPPAQEG